MDGTNLRVATEVMMTEESRKVTQDTKDRYKGEFIRVLVGSGVHGLNVPGHDDRDEMGICIEPRDAIYGLKTFEQHVYRTQPEGHPSGHGDLDLTVYGLKKWLRLAMNGNPTILLLLFVQPEHRVYDDPLADELRELTPLIISKKAGAAFLGYLTAQKQRLLGERGGRKGRPHERLNGAAWDTKYGMHMVRLGFQGVELLTTGRLSLPMPEEERKFCFAVRQGEVELNDVLTKVGELEAQLSALRSDSPLPDAPDVNGINEWLASVYQQQFGDARA